jgi:hypothetical protein
MPPVNKVKVKKKISAESKSCVVTGQNLTIKYQKLNGQKLLVSRSQNLVIFQKLLFLFLSHLNNAMYKKTWETSTKE